MEDAPLPTIMTPKETISETFEINQDNNNYLLTIDIINQNIILNLKIKKDIMKEYENKLTLEEIKQMNKLFSLFSSSQEFIDYMKAIIENNKLEIKNFSGEHIYIELMVEYLFKQNIIKIDLFKKKTNFEIIAKDLYDKFYCLTENFKNFEINYQKIIQEYNNIKDENKIIKEENIRLKKEIEILKEEKKNENDKLISLESNINLCKEYILKNEENKKGNIQIIKDDKINDLNMHQEIDKIIDKKLEKFEADIHNLFSKNQKKKEIIECRGRTLVELLESKLIKIISDKNSTVEINDINYLKKISSAIIIKGGGPLEMVSEFFENNFNKNYFNELDEKTKENFTNKKVEIFLGLKDLDLIKKIKSKDINDYIRQFREKYGVTEKDFTDKDLKILISKFNYYDKNIIIEVLKKLKYIK